MRENIYLIRTHFPDFKIFLYIGKEYSQKLLDMVLKEGGLQVFYTEAVNGVTTIFRYLPILEKNIEVLFVRDTDSEINGRDRWCIAEFMKRDEYLVHSIRDHYWHKSRLMAGTTGFKKEIFDKIRETFHKQFDIIKKTEDLFYGGDEVFLDTHIHPLIKDTQMIHTNINAFSDEKYFGIDYKNDNINFVGNVIEYDELGQKTYRFTYDQFVMRDQLVWLQGQKQYDLILEVAKKLDILKYPFGHRTTILDCLAIANFYLLNLEGSMEIYKMFTYAEITDHIINNSNCFWQVISYNEKTVVAATDLSYEPKDDEVVYYYGQFPIDYRMLPQSNRIYRNIIYYDKTPHKKFVYDPCWEKIDQIYIINLEERKDRYIEVMTELCRMNAPLNKVYHYKAKKDKTPQAAYVGATKNHVDVIKDMMDNGYGNCLFLEDDFVFTGDKRENQENMKRFLEREYDYDICFLSTSRFYKRENYDDLLLQSYQECTTSSGYLLSGKTVKKVYDCVLEGYNALVKDGNSGIYCIDRYWAKLNTDNKMFIFKNKMGYQRPNYSNIKRTVAMFLD